jgi:aspartokinase
VLDDMNASTRLGGFKILNEVIWISVIQPKGHKFPMALSNLMASKKLNLPFLTCGEQNRAWGINLVVDAQVEKKALGLIEKEFGDINLTTAKGAILSIFPHRSKPEIIGALFDLLGKLGDQPIAFANSPSAISAVLSKDVINEATSALFGPFQFGPYRTPADWRLAQKGKEQLYKEVVASYQEKKPKVYGLEWQDKQELLHVKLDSANLSKMGTVFKNFARLGLVLTFLISRPSKEKGKGNLFFCLPESEKNDYISMIEKLLPEASTVEDSSVASFSMNGPHFGDRYGIISELLMALDQAQVNLLGLSCSIHSITGVLPAYQIHSAIKAIQGCFEVPTVIKKTHSQS